MTSPGRTEKDKSFTAVKSPYNLVKPATSICGGAAAASVIRGGALSMPHDSNAEDGNKPKTGARPSATSHF
jgi:hypothetical protein